jgi:hypothetical protein
MYIYPFKAVLSDATLAITSIRSRYIKNDIDAIVPKWTTTGKRTHGKILPKDTVQ